MSAFADYVSDHHKNGEADDGYSIKSEKKEWMSVSVCLSVCLLNSCVWCVCQMALCNLLLHNQNTDSHFHAHALRH